MVLTTWLTLSLVASTSFAYIIDWQCDWDLYNCDYPYSIEETSQFSCVDSNECPTNFICCSHRCFMHKICQPSKNTQPISKPNIDKTVVTKSGTCDVSIECDMPLPSEFTKAFECFVDNDCPDQYKCCFIQCYNHKVCQRAKYEVFPLTTRSSIHPSTSKTTSGENLNLESSTVRTDSETTEYITEITTITISSEESTTLTVPPQIIQKTDDNIVTNVSSIITEYPSELPTTVPITPNIIFNNSVTEVKSKTNISEILESTTEYTIETDEIEASGDTEISEDDEDYSEDVRITEDKITILTQVAVNITVITEYPAELPTTGPTTLNITIGGNSVTKVKSKTNLSETLEDPTKYITEVDEFEASGDIGISEDDEDYSENIRITKDEITTLTHVAVNTTVITEYPAELPTTPNITIGVTAVVKSKTNLSETIEGPTKDTTEIDNFETSVDIEISKDNEVDSNIPTSTSEIVKVTTPNITIGSSVTEVKSKTNLLEFLEGTTENTTEIGDFEASEDIEISEDDKDDTNTPIIMHEIENTTEGYEASKDMEITEYGEDEIPTLIAINTTSAVSEEPEASGGAEIIEDGEDNATVFTSRHFTIVTTSKVNNDLEGSGSSGDFEIIGDDEDFIVISTTTHSVETTSSISSDFTSSDFEILDNEDDISKTNSTVHVMETTTEIERPTDEDTKTGELKTYKNEEISSIIFNYTTTETMSSVTANRLTVESTTMRTTDNKSVVEIGNGKKKDENNITTSENNINKLNSKTKDFDRSRDDENIFSGSGDDTDKRHFDDNKDDDDDDNDDERIEFTTPFSKSMNISVDKENTKESNTATETPLMQSNKEINAATEIESIHKNIENEESLNISNSTEIDSIKNEHNYHGKQTTEVGFQRSEVIEKTTGTETTEADANKSETTTEEDYEPTEVDREESFPKTDLNVTESKSEKSDAVIEKIANLTKPNTGVTGPSAVNDDGEYYDEDYDEDYEEEYEEKPTGDKEENHTKTGSYNTDGDETLTSNVRVENIPKININDNTAINPKVANNSENEENYVEQYEDYYDDYLDD